MWKSDTFNSIFALLAQRKLGQAVSELENYFLGNPTHPFSESFRTLASHYSLLADYWLSGYDDADRERIYTELLYKFYQLTARLAQHECNKRSAFRLTLNQLALQWRSDWSPESIRCDLESFVSEQAMLSLVPEHQRQQRSEQLHSAHQQLLSHLFSYLWTSELWHTADADAYRELLLAPTVDAVDQQLLVSAIMLAAINVFDINKFRVLAQVYSRATDENLRQRALVGWVLVASGAAHASLFTEMGDIIGQLCSDDRCREELAELQMQLAYCIDVDADSRRIREEIMPELLNHSNIRITRDGIVEDEEDSLDDILHPDKAERNMERMEQTMKKMADMQQQGSDIYFAGFSQMKRFPFFNDVSNWFMPFYPQHPAISQIWQNARSRKFLHVITQVGAFCDSDKYSFVLAYDQVVNRLPKSMLELIDKGEAMPTPVGGEIPLDEQRQPAFIRRVFLQNVYRFFKLFPMRTEFRNPFGEEGSSDYLFFSNPLFSATALQSHYGQVAAFFVKRKMHKAAWLVLQCCDEHHRDFQYYMMKGMLAQRLQALAADGTVSTTDCFSRAHAMNPDNERAMLSLARALFADHSFAEALALFERLTQLRPNHLSYDLGKAVCLLRLSRNDDALKILFRLNYDHPDDLQVARSLAWALTLSGKFEQAGKLFQTLMSDTPTSDDLLNYGYCQWLQHHNREAADTFRRLHASDKDFDFEQEFLHPDQSFLPAFGIGEVEVRLMLDQLR